MAGDAEAAVMRRGGRDLDDLALGQRKACLRVHLTKRQIGLERGGRIGEKAKGVGQEAVGGRCRLKALASVVRGGFDR